MAPHRDKYTNTYAKPPRVAYLHVSPKRDLTPRRMLMTVTARTVVNATVSTGLPKAWCGAPGTIEVRVRGIYLWRRRKIATSTVSVADDPTPFYIILR